MEKSFYLDKEELKIICEALEEKMGIQEQIAEDTASPEEVDYFHKIKELFLDLEEELEKYSN